MQRFLSISKRWLLPFASGMLASGAASAHHSQAPYDMTSEVVIEGKIVDLALRAHPGRRGPEARVFGLALTRSDGTLLPLHPFAGFANIPEIDVKASSLSGRWAPGAEGLTAVFGVMMIWPYTDAANAALQSTVSRAGSSLGICEDYPPPLLSIFPDLRQIEVGDATVVMHFEAQGQNLERIIHMNATAHPANVEPSLLGHSIGRWEGDTLVVDTVAFAPHPHGAFAWVASGPDKHMVERFTLAEDRLHLQYDLRMEDPESLTGPATLTMVWDYRPDLEPSGVACDPEIAERLLHE